MPVTHERDGSVVVIRLDRPEKRNAIDRDMAEGLDRAVEALESASDARVGLLVAAGPVFCAGTDMSDPRDKRTERGGEYGLLRRGRTKPLIAVVDGPALGGGFEIVLACDLIVTSERASFGLPETHRGLAATGGGLFRAPRSLPFHIAAELLLTGRRLDAERAFALGLSNLMVPADELMASARELAADVGLGGPVATAETLAALRGFASRDDQLGWWMTGRVKDAVLSQGEAEEGRAAFLERRRPAWVEQNREGRIAP